MRQIEGGRRNLMLQRQNREDGLHDDGIHGHQHEQCPLTFDCGCITHLACQNL